MFLFTETRYEFVEENRKAHTHTHWKKGKKKKEEE